MPEQAAYAIAVVCEADADRRTACMLCDRVLCETVDWIDPETIEHFRKYHGRHDREPYLKWTEMKAMARKQGIVVHGFAGGKPREPDAAMAEQALKFLATLDPPPHAVILTRDADKLRRRREGFEQARGAQRWPFKVVVIGVADTKRECWILAGYEPRDNAERALLERERKELGFDPRLEAEQLTASEDGAKRDAKRVLHALTGGDQAREDACTKELPLTILKQRGAATGLMTYLDEIEARLAPLFGQVARR
ncbi:hypothetical protein [Sorangium sp. So ce1099]|uniref:hypothetical protein n=1 Tax=Sorangium sp. So ce1099 TaxID=3133331 RepID=UPI003F5D6DBA